MFWLYWFAELMLLWGGLCRPTFILCLGKLACKVAYRL